MASATRRALTSSLSKVSLAQTHTPFSPPVDADSLKARLPDPKKSTVDQNAESMLRTSGLLGLPKPSLTTDERSEALRSAMPMKPMTITTPEEPFVKTRRRVSYDLYPCEVTRELERWGSQPDKLAARADAAAARMNGEQRAIYEEILAAVTQGRPLYAFIDGKAGRGKTFLVNALCDKIRSMGQIVIPTATAAFAAQLYPGGRTTHSAFKVPVIRESQMRILERERTGPVELLSTIYPDDPRGKLLKAASTYIWDEGPMSNRDVLACVEEVCRRVNENDRPFGGKVVILIGDFRQTCPVIRRGTKAQVLNASIKASPLWHLFKTYPLTEPIRNAEDRPFADFVDTVGEGAGPSVPLEMLKTVTSAEEITNFVYPTRVLRDPTTCLRRAILAPTHRQVNEYNRAILKQVEGDSRTYIADDTLAAAEGPPSDTALLDDLLPTTQLDILEDATKLVEPSIPVYNLPIQANAVYRLMRNLNIEQGLVKNAKVVVKELGNHHITVRTLSQLDEGGIARYSQDRIIPRILFTTELPSGYILERRQFPLAPAYATTFHSCIGLTLDVLGVDLTRPVFGHGQLYTALSRIRHRSHARVRLRPGQSKTKNITYEELLHR